MYYLFLALPTKPPIPLLISTIFHAAVLQCDLRGKKDDEEIFIVVYNIVTKQQVYHQQYFNAVLLNEVKISHLLPDTVYAAEVRARNVEFNDLIAVSETLLFTTPGML